MTISGLVRNKESVGEPYPGTEHGAERQAADDAERSRRWIVNLVFIIYWLLIFEGVLRKWVFPDAFKILFFIRDPFVLAVYVLSASNYTRLPAKPLLAVGIFLGSLALAVGLTGGAELIVLGYGWRNYFYYIPLAFVIGANFRQADLDRLVRQTLLVAIPIAVLVCLQIVSPMDAIINAGLTEEGLDNSGTARGFVRTYGTFTSGSGQMLFVSSLTAMFLANLMRPEEQRPVKGFLLAVASVAVALSLVLSGSRAAYILSIFIMLFAMSSSVLVTGKAQSFRAVLRLLIIVVTTTAAASIVQRDPLDAISERIEEAHSYESAAYGPLSAAGRIIFDFTNVTNAISWAPPLGYGIGSFGNAFWPILLVSIRGGRLVAQYL